MSGINFHAGMARMFLLIAVLVTLAGSFSPCLADQKTNQEPVRTTMPEGESTHSSKMMMAPVMTPEERNALYLQWGIISAALFTAVTALVVFIFLNTRKETEDEEENEQENAYVAPTAPAQSEDSKPTVVATSGASAPSVAPPSSLSSPGDLAAGEAGEA